MRFLSLISSKNGAERTVASQEAKQGLGLDSVVQVMHHFPIGARLQYYPEYQKEIKIDTIVVAYVINDYVIYANKDIQILDQATSKGVEIMQEGVPVPQERIFSFQVLVPHIDRKEIDFRVEKGSSPSGVAVAAEKVARDFQRGNIITLFCRNVKAQGILHIDTEVRKSVVFNTGLYAKRRLVMLEPMLDSFECVDLRRFGRINTQIPAEIYRDKKKMPGGCVIQDFSERFVRIEFSKANQAAVMPLLAEGGEIVLRIHLESEAKDLIVDGKIFRKRRNNVIIALQSLMKNGRFQTMDELDELFIKAVMLEHPATKRH